MTWKLENPRAHVTSAYINTQDNEMFYLSYSTKYGGINLFGYKSVKAAKGAFSKMALEPRYCGPNIWKEIPDAV